MIIDCAEFYLNDEYPCIEFMASKPTWKISTQEHLKMENRDLLVCTNRMPGYSMRKKQWAYFDVSRLKEIKWNTRAFERLVLSADKKRFILSIIASRESKTAPFDDLIREKGRNITFLLHGPPGVGKTLTAGMLLHYCPSC